MLEVHTAGSRRVLGGFRQNLGGFAAGSCPFSPDSRRSCSGFLLVLVSANIVLDLLISGGPEGAQNDPRIAKQVATGSPRGLKKQLKMMPLLQIVFGRSRGCIFLATLIHFRCILDSKFDQKSNQKSESFKIYSYETLTRVRSHVMKQNADFQEDISQLKVLTYLYPAHNFYPLVRAFK